MRAPVKKYLCLLVCGLVSFIYWDEESRRADSDIAERTSMRGVCNGSTLLMYVALHLSSSCIHMPEPA